MYEPEEREKVLSIEDVAYKDAWTSPWGHVIMADGTVYALRQRFYHGIVLAILFPDLAKARGFDPPTNFSSVYDYQRFELDNKKEFGVIRTCFSRMLGPSCSVDKGRAAATQAQITSLTRIFKESGIGLNEEVATTGHDMTIRQLLKDLQKAEPDA